MAMRQEVEQASIRAVEADTRADEADQRAASTDRVLIAVERLASGSGGKASGGTGSSTIPTLVDTRGIGKPGGFGKRDQKTLELLYLGWRRKTRNYLVSVYPSMKQLLDWCQTEDKPLTEPTLISKANELMSTSGQNIKDMHQQLYLMLISSTDGTANNLAANETLGFEAWRKLSKTYDPTGGGRV